MSGKHGNVVSNVHISVRLQGGLEGRLVGRGGEGGGAGHREDGGSGLDLPLQPSLHTGGDLYPMSSHLIEQIQLIVTFYVFCAFFSTKSL